MADLKLAPEPERGPFRAVLIAMVVLGLVAAGVFLLNPRKTAEITVKKMDLFAPHTEFQQSAGGMHVLGAAPESEDDLYVIATVAITDKLRLPLFLTGETTSLTNADGSVVEGRVIAPRDFARLAAIYPNLAAFGQPMDDNDPIQAGATREGKAVLLFPGMNAAAWQTKKSASLTYTLAHQLPQTVALP
jgi:hypothetical protein